MKDLLIDYALKFIGINYKWGGSNPMSGFDCSGLVQECLRGVGLLPDPTDHSAQELHDYFKMNGNPARIKRGCIAFYGRSLTEIIHVALLIDDNHIIEAGHGGPRVVDAKTADANDAFIRIRPVMYRKDFLVAYDCEKEGL
jgi:cell wall-associated NlpC family hydrolase